jgi:hypothetical protein
MLPEIAAAEPRAPAGAMLVEPVFAGRCAPIYPLSRRIRVVRWLGENS